MFICILLKKKQYDLFIYILYYKPKIKVKNYIWHHLEWYTFYKLIWMGNLDTTSATATSATLTYATQTWLDTRLKRFKLGLLIRRDTRIMIRRDTRRHGYAYGSSSQFKNRSPASFAWSFPAILFESFANFASSRRFHATMRFVSQFFL